MNDDFDWQGQSWDGAVRGLVGFSRLDAVEAAAASAVPFAWISDDDLRALGRLALEHDFDPEWLAIVMYSESGLRPSAVNPNRDSKGNARPGGARGLIQFLPSTLRGMFGFRDFEIADFPTWSFQGQLVYVGKFLAYWEKWAAKHLQSPGMIYQTIFLPGTLKRGSGPDVVLTKKGESAYDANPLFDASKKGWISVGDLDAHLDRLRRLAVWPSFVARLRAVTGIAPRKPWASLLLPKPSATSAATSWLAPAAVLTGLFVSAGALAFIGWRRA